MKMTSSTGRSPIRYTAALLVAVLIPSALLIAASYRIDPFRLHTGTQALQYEDGIDLFWYMRLHKPYQILATTPDKLIVGSSRAGRLPPEAMSAQSGRAYNASMPGATLYEILRTLEHAHEVNELDAVLLAVDYAMFRSSQDAYLTGYADDRLLKTSATAQDAIRYRWQRLIDRWNTLFSRGALTADITTLRGVRQSKRDFYSDGTWVSGFTVEEKPLVYAMLARQKFREFSDDNGELDFAGLEKIIRFCKEQGIQLTLLLSPTHAHLMSVIARAGGWSHYLRYQRKVIDIVQRYRDKGADVQVFGLEHLAELVQESPDASDDWFRDGIHYSMDTGDNIVRCLYSTDGSRCEDARKPLELNRENRDHYLQAVNRNRETYRQTQPVWFKRLDKQLIEAGKARDERSARTAPQ